MDIQAHFYGLFCSLEPGKAGCSTQNAASCNSDFFLFEGHHHSLWIRGKMPLNFPILTILGGL
jgi:hypothetical protein